MSRSKTEAAAVLYFSSSTRVTRVRERRRRKERGRGSRGWVVEKKVVERGKGTEGEEAGFGFRRWGYTLVRYC